MEGRGEKFQTPNSKLQINSKLQTPIRRQRRATVAQVSKPAVSPISKSAARATLCAGRLWKPAIQQTWKSALRILRRQRRCDSRNIEHGEKTCRLEFGAWSLEFFWNLEFGIWNFSPQYASRS